MSVRQRGKYIMKRCRKMCVTDVRYVQISEPKLLPVYVKVQHPPFPLAWVRMNFALGSCYTTRENLNPLFGCSLGGTPRLADLAAVLLAQLKVEMKGRREDSSLQSVLSSHPYPVSASQDFKHVHLFPDGSSTQE